MYSAKIFLALETILDWDLIFLNSSQASQNSRFSSLNSVRRKALKAASPSVGTQAHLYSWLTDGEWPHKTISPATLQSCLHALSPNPPLQEPPGKAGSGGIASASSAMQSIHALNPRSPALLHAWGEDSLAVPVGAGCRM